MIQGSQQLELNQLEPKPFTNLSINYSLPFLRQDFNTSLKLKEKLSTFTHPEPRELNTPQTDTIFPKFPAQLTTI